MNKVPVVFTFNDAWAKIPACVCITSLLENARPTTHYEIIVVSSDISEKNQRALCRQVDLFKQHSIRFIYYTLKDYCRPNKLISPDAYTRYFLPDILDSYRKIIYADADLIFQGDLSKVFNTDISGDYVGAVLDIKANELIMKDRWPRFDRSWFGSYFNSGFLLMDLQLMRANRTPEKIGKLAQDPNRNYRTNDQCIANKFFNPKVRYLSLKYNFQNRYPSYGYDEPFLEKLNIAEAYHEAENASCVIHYTWIKPWQLKRQGYANVWWHYAKITPFYWNAQKLYLIFQIKHLPSILKKVRRWLFQIRWKKDKKTIRFFGICLVKGR